MSNAKKYAKRDDPLRTATSSDHSSGAVDNTGRVYSSKSKKTTTTTRTHAVVLAKTAAAAAAGFNDKNVIRVSHLPFASRPRSIYDVRIERLDTTAGFDQYQGGLLNRK
jgi:hypothetical protein